jgi:hypothetical protein
MNLSSVIIKIEAFDNKPYVRSLTATLAWNPLSADVFVPIPQHSYLPFSWYATTTSPLGIQSLTATTPKYTKYDVTNAELTGNPDHLTPLIIDFVAPTYDPAQSNYDLYNITLSAVMLSGHYSTHQQINFDSFPIVPLTVYSSHENTDNSSLMYRLTSSKPYVSVLKASSPYLPLDKTFNTPTLTAQYIVTDDKGKNNFVTNYTDSYIFNRALPGTNTISLEVQTSTLTISGNNVPLASAHTFYETLSVVFLKGFPTAPDFIAYPTYVVPKFGDILTLTDANYTSTQGLKFYGEGHTESINISSTSLPDGAKGFIWYLQDQEHFTNYNTRVINVTSEIGYYPVLPISVKVIGDTVTKESPNVQYDDVTGKALYYPYYASTVDAYGNELQSNTTLKQSVSVLPYPKPKIEYITSLPTSAFFLPATGTETFYASYNLSSVAGANITWTEKSINWDVNSSAGWDVLTTDVGADYFFDLQYSGDIPYINIPFTVDQNTAKTHLNVNVNASITGILSAYPFDWQKKVTNAHAGSSVNIYGIPELNLYTVNAYELTGTDVVFQNNFTLPEYLTEVTITTNDANTPIIVLTGDDITKDITINFSSPKTISLYLLGDTIFGTTVYKNYDNFIKIVDQYDTLNTSVFTTERTPLTLPYETPPFVSPNDNVVSDNINSVISKIYNNITYLVERSTVYDAQDVHFDSWLGTTNTSNLTSTLTWQDLDCTLNPDTSLTWVRLSSQDYSLSAYNLFNNY